jgi:hypothetical protein
MPREWNTPIRALWNPVIKKCLDAIDEHIRNYVETGDELHLSQAEVLRKYVKDLKIWIQMARGEMKLNLSKLIFIVCISGVGFVGLNFIACNFMIPGSIISANVLGD